MVDDPSACPEEFPTEEDQKQERERLFRLIEELVRWENTTNEELLEQAREEIRRSWRRTCADNAGHPLAAELFDPDKLPAFHDPFAGGGALPLEAQRLGLEAHASDLNPVAVLINKAMIEIPPKFAERPPVNPEARPGGSSAKASLIERDWTGAQGLAEDVRYYGQWMRDEAERRIGYLYPPIEVTAEMVRERPDLKQYQNRKLTVIAWLWARTVKSPNPAFADVDVPLASTFMLSTKRGKEAYVEPVIEGRGYRFEVKVGKPKDTEAAKAGTSAGKRQAFRCLMSGVPIPYGHIRNEGKAKRMGDRLMTIVAGGDRGRVYLSPTPEHEEIAREAHPTWKPDCEMPKKHRNFQGPVYGLNNIGDLFTPRQLVALITFSDLVAEAMTQVKQDAAVTDLPEDGHGLDEDGCGATAYAEAVGVYLACGISRLANRLATTCVWNKIGEKIEQVFARQAIPMTWDFPEANPFSTSTGGWSGSLGWIPATLEFLPSHAQCIPGIATQANAIESLGINRLTSTDPPYYDNIAYADLSDFFYVWLRRSLKSTFPGLLATLAVPKAEELVATPSLHGSKEEAQTFFLNGMTDAMRRLASQALNSFPVTIYYAFKQSETKGETGTSSTGWETFLDAVIKAGFSVTGTLPMRTERPTGVKVSVNALASSILLVCRKRPQDAPLATRREFVAALKAELPEALGHLQSGNVAPVDLAQASIGPGMAVYTRYTKVLDAQGKSVSVRDALALINQTLDEVLAEQEGEFDPDTRWALAWFEQQGFTAGEYGVAETLSTAKNTSVSGMVEAGILESKAGEVRLLRPEELPEDWDPATDRRIPAWEVVHQLVRVLESDGETGAASLVRQLGGLAEIARELAYRLYAVAERKNRAAEALSYNALVQSWPEIARLARQEAPAEQGGLFGV